MTIQELAAKVSAEHFIQGTRDNGEVYWRTINAPEWVEDMVREAHGDMLPDDVRFEMVVEALDRIGDCTDVDRARDETQPDVYNTDRLRWLSSHIHRAEYCNEAFSSGLVATEKNFDIMDVIGLGQYLEKCEVFDCVRQALEEQLEETDDNA